MGAVNHECYVSLEVAKLLKQAGFDWRTNKFYSVSDSDNSYVFNDNEFPVDWNNNDSVNNIHAQTNETYYSAPTLGVAQRWLREEKGIYIGITAIENKRAVTNSDGWTFHYKYGKPTFDCDIQDERCENMCTLDDSFDTYEEALETGIKKALEIILKKGE